MNKNYDKLIKCEGNILTMRLGIFQDLYEIEKVFYKEDIYYRINRDCEYGDFKCNEVYTKDGGKYYTESFWGETIWKDEYKEIGKFGGQERIDKWEAEHKEKYKEIYLYSEDMFNKYWKKK